MNVGKRGRRRLWGLCREYKETLIASWGEKRYLGCSVAG